jgi:hypothetical protein
MTPAAPDASLRQMAQDQADIAHSRPEIAEKSRHSNCDSTRREGNTMKKNTIRDIAGREIKSRAWALVLCGLAGFALAVPAAAKDVVLGGAAVDVKTAISAVREVPAGNPLPGLHVDAKVKGRMMDIYIAPTDFAVKYDIKVSKGEYVHIVGTQVKSGEADVVLAREITKGSIDNVTGVFHEDMTIHLRNDEGPLW